MGDIDYRGILTQGLLGETDTGTAVILTQVLLGDFTQVLLGDIDTETNGDIVDLHTGFWRFIGHRDYFLSFWFFFFLHLKKITSLHEFIFFTLTL